MTVGLNLFTSRMGERQQSLSALLQALGLALQAAAQALQACQADCEGSLLLGPALQAAEHELATLPVCASSHARAGLSLSCLPKDWYTQLLCFAIMCCLLDLCSLAYKTTPSINHCSLPYSISTLADC